MNCKHCNTPLNADATFCPVCGKVLDEAEKETRAPEVPAIRPLPNAIDDLLDEAYVAAAVQSDFESNTPLTEVYQGTPDSMLSAQIPVSRKSGKGKKVVITIISCLLIAAIIFGALVYFEIIPSPFASSERPVKTEQPETKPEPKEPTEPEPEEIPYTDPVFSDFSATPISMLTSQTTEVLFTLHVENPSNADMSGLGVFNGEIQLCVLTDDGKNGDETANDGIYSAKVPLKSGIPQSVSVSARLGMLQSDFIELQFHQDLDAADLLASDLLMDEINNFTDYNAAKEFMLNSDLIEDSTIYDDETQTIYYETVYGVTHVWPHTEISIVSDEPLL